MGRKVKHVYMPGGVSVTPIPAVPFEDVKFGAYRVSTVCHAASGEVDGHTPAVTVSGTSPVHAAYRYMWQQPLFTGGAELRIEEILAGGRTGRVWALDVECAPVVLSSRLLSGRGKKRQK